MTDLHDPPATPGDYDLEMVARLRSTYRAVASTTEVTPRALELPERRSPFGLRIAIAGMVALALIGLLTLARSPRSDDGAVGGPASLEGIHAIPGVVPAGLVYAGTVRSDDRNGAEVVAIRYEGGRTRMTVTPVAGAPWQDTDVEVERLPIEGADIAVDVDGVRQSFIPIEDRVFAKLTERSGFTLLEWIADAPRPIKLRAGVVVRLQGGIGGMSTCIVEAKGNSPGGTCFGGTPGGQAFGLALSPTRAFVYGYGPQLATITVGGAEVETDLAQDYAGTPIRFAVVEVDPAVRPVIEARDRSGNVLSSNSVPRWEQS